MGLPPAALQPAVHSLHVHRPGAGAADRHGNAPGRARVGAPPVGRGPALALLAVLAASCFGALVSELSGLAGVGQAIGLPVGATMLVAVFGLMAMVATGSYRSVERVALFFGLFEAAFVAMAWRASPGLAPIVAALVEPPPATRLLLPARRQSRHQRHSLGAALPAVGDRREGARADPSGGRARRNAGGGRHLSGDHLGAADRRRGDLGNAARSFRSSTSKPPSLRRSAPASAAWCSCSVSPAAR